MAVARGDQPPNDDWSIPGHDEQDYNGARQNLGDVDPAEKPEVNEAGYQENGQTRNRRP